MNETNLRVMAERVVGGHRGQHTVLEETLAGYVLTLSNSLDAAALVVCGCWPVEEVW